MLDILQFLNKELNPPPLDSETCALQDCAGRVSAADLFSAFAVPHYDESTRDGYALGAVSADVTVGYKLIEDEAFAGNTKTIRLLPGQACHVMTGGMIPYGAVRVVPRELVTVARDGVFNVFDLSSLPVFIKKAGADIAKGALLVKQGTPLQPDHLALLAQSGYRQVEVYRRPLVGFFSTGSELIDVGSKPAPGQKVASNRYLLQQLCRSFGANVHDLGIVDDNQERLTEFVRNLSDKKFDLLISTGGMGPGKYDLLEKVFTESGGRMMTNSLPLAPGKSTLVGWLQDSLFFGLPGTPSAIRPLFTELVSPALLSLQGLTTPFPQTGRAILQTPLDIKKGGQLSLRPGKLEFQGITRIVRLVEDGEVANCYILLFPERGSLHAGTVVQVHETRSPLET